VGGGGVETKGEERVRGGDGGQCEKRGGGVMVAGTGSDNNKNKHYWQLAEDMSGTKGKGTQREREESLPSSGGRGGGVKLDISFNATPLDELKVKHTPPLSDPPFFSSAQLSFNYGYNVRVFVGVTVCVCDSICVVYSLKNTTYSLKNTTHSLKKRPYSVCDLWGFPCMCVTHTLDSPAPYHTHIVRPLLERMCSLFLREYLPLLRTVCIWDR